jgi:amidohydrolase
MNNKNPTTLAQLEVSMNDINTNTNDFDAELINWRHDFHQHPELGFEEHLTAQKVAEILRSCGIEVYEGVGKTGVVGVLKCGTGGSAIGLRADMDALAITEENDIPHKSVHEGRMHACGHDGHTTMLLGAAKKLSNQREFNGTVVFIFQPAEEHGQGALAMIEDELFERFPIDSVYGIHNMPSLTTGHFAIRSGPVMACEDNFEITIIGKGGHAALPHLSIDPIVIGSEIVLALQTVLSRTFDPLERGVLSVTDFSVEATRNVIPEKVVLRGDTRSFTSDIQSKIETTMQRIVAGICAAHGAEYEFSYSREFTATINTEKEANIAADVARSIFGADNVHWDSRPIMASEDFGFMLQQKPGCYILLGNGGDGPGGCGLHSSHYDFNDEILPVGVEFWVQLVQSQLKLES